MPAIKIYDKRTSLRYTSFYIRYDYLQDQNSAGSLFKELMFCTQYALCFPACLFEIWAKCVEGQCRNFFPGLLCVHEFFFHLIFPWMMFFLYLARNPTPPPAPPHNFLMVRPKAQSLLAWMPETFYARFPVSVISL